MKLKIAIPAHLEQELLAHFFQNHLEQGAFLFSRTKAGVDAMVLEVTDVYLVPPEGWEVQHELHLEMRDAERGKIMKMARDTNSAIVDCHSHPESHSGVQFSGSDRVGITEFAAYAKWKLPGHPYAAMVWGENSLDAVVWHGDFHSPHVVDEVLVFDGPTSRVVRPQRSWFLSPRRSERRNRSAHGR
jgi:hypothetical protein